MFFRLCPFLFLIPLITVCFSCGSAPTKSIKEFHLAVTTDDKSYNSMFQTLVTKYNQMAGFQALNFSTTTDGMNSDIRVVEGLAKTNPDKVGFGQWISETDSKGNCSFCPPTEQTTTYTMSLQFDADYIKTRLVKIAPDRNLTPSTNVDGLPTEARIAFLDLFNIFSHEVGHGLQRNHVDDANAIMSPYVGCRDTSDLKFCGRKYTSYFSNDVPSFFNSNG